MFIEMMKEAQIQALNSRLSIAGVAEVVAGNGGLPMVRITGPAAAAEIYLQGAQVTSWRAQNGGDALFVSDRSKWEDGRAIRGGIPVCFPWFRAKADDPAAPAHGFARTREWRLESLQATKDKVVVALSTESDDATRRWWPYEFRLGLVITVGASLHLQLTGKNAGAVPFRFEEALHTYFRVSDVQNVRVRGLDQVKYLDNVDRNREKTQTGDVIFTAKTDNAYLKAHGAADLIDAAGRTLRTEKTNSATTVVWNPWQDGAASLSDLGADEWRNFACVEASNILESAIELAPGQEHCMEANILIEPQ
jgi:glucose-6-phosphate 1-epimerase